MGLCCCKNDLECEHCGVPRSYYTNIYMQHVNHAEDITVMEQSIWIIIVGCLLVILQLFSGLVFKEKTKEWQGYVLEEEVRLPEWSKGSR